jgi:hypothetical protein
MTRDRYVPARRQAVPRRDGLPPRSAGATPGLMRRPTQRADNSGSLGVLALLIAVIAAPVLIFAALAQEPGRPPGTSGLVGAGSATPTASGAATPPSTGGATASPQPSPATQVPIVPVVSFWSTDRSISRDELVAAAEGRSSTYERVIVHRPDRDAIAAGLDVTIPESVTSGSAPQIRAAVRRGALGLMRASDVTPAVRALAIDGRSLFGTERVGSLSDWPLLIPVPGMDPARVEPAATWTMVAAGDILLDRGVARQVKVLGKGIDFPFDGGSAEITGYTCCSGFGYRVPTYRRTGERGAMREKLRSADLALANLESPVDNEFVYHTEGTTFSGDPRLLDGIRRAGIDFVSLGNNHIRDAGSDGVLETIAELRRRRIAYSGAGANLTAARRPAVLSTKGLRIAVIGCDAAYGGAWTNAERAGARPCNRAMIEDITAAKRSADIVIVYPHWGVEYRATPAPQQRAWAREWTAAGADIVIGNHAHWAGAVEQVNNRLVFYALGNFVFDQMWQEQTMEGLVLELTFQGRRVTQAWLHPTLVIDQAQPNFLDPAAPDGARVMKQVRDASEDMLPY